MSAKLLYSLSDDNPKQLGCINGFLQHFLSGRVVNGHAHHHHKSLPPGQAKMESKDTKEVTKKEKKSLKNNDKEITPRISLDQSSMVSSSSSTSSSLSPSHHQINTHQLSLKSSRNVMRHVDSPRPLQPSNLPNQKNSNSKINTPPRTQNHSNSIKDNKKKAAHARRLSYDGRETRESVKVNELPRLSLDSRKARIKSASASASASEFKSSDYLHQEELGSNRPVSSIVAKLMGLDDLPTSTPKSRRSEDLDLVSRSTRSTGESDTDSERHSVSIYKEIDKRLGEIDFRKSSKDLRALKHILEAMQRSKSKIDTENQGEENIEESCVKKSQFVKLEDNKGSLARVRTRQGVNGKLDGVEKRRAKDLSPKIQEKCKKLEKFSQERRARSNQEPKNLTKQKTKSSRQNVEARNRKVVDQCDIVHTPRPSQKLHKTMNEESMSVVKEQPSPVSVLDADFYGEESLSPIKKKPTVFRDDESAPVSAQGEWIAMDTNHLSNSTRSSFSSYNMGTTKETTKSLHIIEEENDFLTSIIAKDLAKKSENWTDFSSENSWLVLDIERLLFKDLIVELVHS